MAKVKQETTRYLVTSADGERRTLVQTRYVRSERIGGVYRDRPMRSEIRDETGRVMEPCAGSRFRDPATGIEFEVTDCARQQRAVTIAA